jgi:hypothetical protein
VIVTVFGTKVNDDVIETGLIVARASFAADAELMTTATILRASTRGMPRTSHFHVFIARSSPRHLTATD